MAGLSRDRSHLRSATLSDVVPRGLGNTAAGRFLREHERIISTQFERAGLEMTEFARMLVARLGRIAWQLSEVERRVERGGKISESELRTYTSVNTQYTGILRELLLHRHKHPRPEAGAPSSDQPKTRSASLTDILAEME